jgi:hypothetical protein
MMQIMIGRINSIFRFTLSCEYLDSEKMAVANEIITEPVRTEPLIATIKPTVTIASENRRI